MRCSDVWRAAHSMAEGQRVPGESEGGLREAELSAIPAARL